MPQAFFKVKDDFDVFNQFHYSGLVSIKNFDTRYSHLMHETLETTVRNLYCLLIFLISCNYRESHETWQLVNSLKMSSSLIFLSCLIPKWIIIINFIWQSLYSKINHRLRYIGVKDFSNELNCKKSLNLIQYLEDDILNYLLTVMFRGTPCTLQIPGKSCNK